MTQRWRRLRTWAFAACGAAELAAVITLAATLPNSNPTRISGSVRCASGKPVSGIYIDGFSGGSGFVREPAKTYNSTDDGTVSYTFLLANGGKYEVRVGCGHDGDGGEWLTANFSGYLEGEGPYHFICADPPQRRGKGRCRRE